MKQKRIAILFGGRSHEHEISLVSAASVIQNMDRTRFDILPIYIDKQGAWWRYDLQKMQYDSVTNAILPQAAEVFQPLAAPSAHPSFEVVFPVMHGPLCEDGALQGFLEMLELPYVGANVLTSAVGMDKVISKIVVANAGVSVAPFVLLDSTRWSCDKASLLAQINATLTLPFFVKPSNTGSSVGVSKVESLEALPAAIEEAFQYHGKVIVEQGVEGREIEVSVLESLDGAAVPQVSLPGEVIVKSGFYSYEKKYCGTGEAELVMPAALTEAEVRRVQDIAVRAYQALQAESMARVDLFLAYETGTVYFNEINTLPGFTAFSMYPQLWQLSGLPYAALLTHLIELALARHERKLALQTSYQQAIRTSSNL